MLEIKVIVGTQAWETQGVKEALGMFLERWGNARVVEVREIKAQQMEIKGVAGSGNRHCK